MKSTYDAIRLAMRQAEKEVLDHLRRRQVAKVPVTHTMLFGKRWQNAFNRLEKAKRVRWSGKKFTYYAVKNARPITPPPVR